MDNKKVILPGDNIENSVADPENSSGRWLFSNMGTKIFKTLFCRGYADVKPSDLS